MSVLKDRLRNVLQDVLWQLQNLTTANPTALGELVGCTAAYALENQLATNELIATAEEIVKSTTDYKVNANKTNVMVDLETLGTKPGCKVMAIGATVFSQDGLGSTFYRAIKRDGQAPLLEDPDTLAWWAKQSDEARGRLFGANVDNVSLHDALEEFTRWLSVLGDEVLVWGNGADFDNPILSAAYSACGKPQPWGPWSGRCYRTLKNLRPDIKLKRQGVYHDALDDALSQAAHAVELLTAIGGWETTRAKA